ncbi:hypothetical protein PENTCL1PPCAC_14665, partial [Pristionchus entomophagus]
LEGALLKAWTTLPFLPAYLIVIKVFRRLRIVLAEKSSSMSDRTRYLQINIIKGLVVQSCLPTIDTFAVGIYVCSQLLRLPSNATGYLVLLSFELVALLHPLVSLYFVQPYR